MQMVALVIEGRVLTESKAWRVGAQIHCSLAVRRVLGHMRFEPHATKFRDEVAAVGWASGGSV